MSNIILEAANSGGPLLGEAIVQNTAYAKFLEELGPIAPFRPCSWYISDLSLVVVMRKDCSFTAQRLGAWSEMHWQNHRPWYALWEKRVGFSVYCPPALGLSGSVPVRKVLDRVLKTDPEDYMFTSLWRKIRNNIWGWSCDQPRSI